MIDQSYIAGTCSWKKFSDMFLLTLELRVVTPITTWVKQSLTLVVNIIMIIMICLVAADHPVIMVDILIQGEVMAVMGSIKSAGRKDVMTFVLLLHIFMADMSLVVLITHVGSLLKIILAVVNLYVEVRMIITESLL